MSQRLEFKPVNYKKLTVNDVRKNYWDKNKKSGKPIKYYSVQTYGDVFVLDENQQIPFFGTPEIFIPDGTLHHTNMKTKQKQTIIDWLSFSHNGPYKKEDEQKNGLSDFYFLGGTFVYGQKKQKGHLQICSRPLNVVSDDCLDELHCWIRKPT